MGRSKASKRLKRLERQVDKCRTQRTHYDKLIDELESRKQELLIKLDPKLSATMQNNPYSKPAESLLAVPANDELKEACWRVKKALEQVKASVEEFQQTAKCASTSEMEVATSTSDTTAVAVNNFIPDQAANRNTVQKDSNLLALINSPEIRQVAQDLMGELLKDN